VHQHGGFVLYLRQEGRGIGLYRKLDAYLLQDQGHDTYAANRMLGHKDDERNYDVAAHMLMALKVRRIRLLTNNPEKRSQLVSAGIDVVDQVLTGVFLNPHNRRYLEAKVHRASHTIDLASSESIQ
jgi:GTP cyclohydrolase II